MMSLSRIISSFFALTFIASAFSAAACSSDDVDESGPGGGAPGIGGGGPAGGGSAAGGSAAGAGGGAYTFCGPAVCPPSIEGVDLTTPVSFRTDIYAPLFQVGCGAAGCHSGAAPAADLYFGQADDPLSDADISALVTQLTTAPAVVAPAAKNVVPGDWENSFLMMKLDGCQSRHGFACNLDAAGTVNACEQSCGDGMGLSETDSVNITAFATTAEQLVPVNKVRAWIAQGALDN